MEAAFTGGARIGLVNATWPFARLVVSQTRLTLSCFQGTYDFPPSEVVALESYGSIPFFSRGIRIRHTRQDYPAKIIFWYLGNPDSAIAKIHEASFLPCAPSSAEIKWRGIPVRWIALVFFILMWNALFLPMTAFAKPPIALALIPLLATVLACWGIRKYPRVQEIVLRNGRSINEIKAYLSLIQTVCGILIIIFAIVSIIQAFV